MTLSKLGIHTEPKSRQGMCDRHGTFESICYFRDLWSECPLCRAELEQEKKSKQEAANKEKILQEWQKKIGQSGIPERFKDRTLAVFKAETPAQKHALEFACAYANSFQAVLDRGRSALFIGRPGTGKTHLAAGIALHIIKENRTVIFTTVMRAIRRVKDTWHKNSDETESEAVASLVFPDLLILDEVGLQFGSETERMILFDVLNERYEKRRPVILLSNLTTSEVRGYLGERIFDRLREDGGEVVPFSWESWRGKVTG